MRAEAERKRKLEEKKQSERRERFKVVVKDLAMNNAMLQKNMLKKAEKSKEKAKLIRAINELKKSMDKTTGEILKLELEKRKLLKDMGNC